MDVNLKTGEMGFDSSLFDTLDVQLTATEFAERLIRMLQPVLQLRFPNEYQKQQIHPFHGRVSCACPFCGDSMKNSHAKRGNFILSGKHNGYYKCFNCGAFMRIDKFFSDFNVQFELDAVNYLTNNLGNFRTQTDFKYDMSLLLDTESIDKYAIDRQEFAACFGLIEVKGSSVWTWLTARVQYQEDKFLYNPVKDCLFILNLTKSGRILGAQKRLFKGNNRFESYKLSKLYEIMRREFTSTQKQIDYLDALSMVFNICLINFNNEIILLEGPMDSFLVQNSISNTGANKQLPIELPIKYLYDSDETGIKKAIEHINKDGNVFLWQKFLHDLDAPYRKKWDINDIMIWAKENDKKIPNILSYFSSDPLDSIDI